MDTTKRMATPLIYTSDDIGTRQDIKATPAPNKPDPSTDMAGSTPHRQPSISSSTPDTSPETSMDHSYEILDDLNNSNNERGTCPSPPVLLDSDGVGVANVAEGGVGEILYQRANSSPARSVASRSNSDGSVRSCVQFREKRNAHSVHCRQLSGSRAGTPDGDGSRNDSPMSIGSSPGINEEESISIPHLEKSTSNTSMTLMEKYGLSHSLKDANRHSSKYSSASTAKHDAKATSTMFTAEDVNSITPLQITTYLTLEERKNIGTKVLSSKMRRGYTLASGSEAVGGNSGGVSTVCNTCDMPLLCKKSKVLNECAICPVLKKKVLKKILASTSVETVTADASPDELMEVRKALFDTDRTQSYYDRFSMEQNVTASDMGVLFHEGRDAVAYARKVLASNVVVNEKAESKEGDSKVATVETKEEEVPPESSQDEQTVHRETTSISSKPSTPTGLPPRPSPPPTPPRVAGRPPRPSPSSPRKTGKLSSNSSLCSNSSRRSQSSRCRSPSSSNSISSVASDVHSIASAALLTIVDQIDDTKLKMMESTDVNEQIAYAELLTKLSGAAVAVKKLEETWMDL